MDIQNSSVYYTINLLANRPLDQSEKKLIHELTIKKRQSKKQTMSQRQLVAKHQLAQELRLERRDAMEIDSLRYAVQSHLLDRSYSSAAASSCSSSSISSSSAIDSSEHRLSLLDRLSIGGSFGGADHRLKLTGRLLSSSQSTASNWSNYSVGGHQLNKSLSDVSARSQSLHSSGSSASSLPSSSSSSSESSSSVARSTSSSSSIKSRIPSDLDETNMSNVCDDQTMDQLGDEQKELEIRLKKCQLEQLNEELETRLYQYEYLVSQERALLRNHNMMLFTNKVANNFHES